MRCDICKSVQPVFLIAIVSVLAFSGCGRLFNGEFPGLANSTSGNHRWQQVDLERFYIDPSLARAQKEESENSDSAIKRDSTKEPKRVAPDESAQRLRRQSPFKQVASRILPLDNDPNPIAQASYNAPLAQPAKPVRQPLVPDRAPVKEMLTGRNARAMLPPTDSVITLRPQSPLVPNLVPQTTNASNALEPIHVPDADKQLSLPLSMLPTKDAPVDPNATPCSEDCNCEECQLKTFEDELIAALDARKAQKKAEATTEPAPASSVSAAKQAGKIDVLAAQKKLTAPSRTPKPPEPIAPLLESDQNVVEVPVPSLVVKNQLVKSINATSNDFQPSSPTTKPLGINSSQASNDFEPVNPAAQVRSEEPSLTEKLEAAAATTESIDSKTRLANETKPAMTTKQPEPEPVQPTPLAWDRQLELTIEAFENQVIQMSPTDYRKSQLQRGLAILHALQDRLANGKIAVEIPQHRAFWQHQLNAILNMLATTDLKKKNQVDTALVHLENAVGELKQLAELQIKTLEFCSQVNGYGQFVAMKPQFGTGDKTLIYCEIENFAVRKIQQAGESRFQTRLKSRLEFIDATGKVVHHVEFPVVEDTGRNRRRDFYMHLPLTIDFDAQGEYVMKVEIVDLESNKSASLEKSVTLGE